MKSMPRLLSLLLLLLLPVSGAFAESRVFHLQHRAAADVADAVRSMLGEGSRVAASGHSLFVEASADDLGVAADLVGMLDRPLKMLRIEVRQERRDAAENVQLEAAGSGTIGSSTVLIGRPGPSPRRGAAVRWERDGRVQVGGSSTGIRENRQVSQFVATLEGSPAQISIGRRIPFTERWLLLARRHTHVIETVRYEAVDTGFEVRPELLGGLVQLAIRPYMAFLDPQQPREIRFQELTTTVRIPLGEWFDLGGTMTGRDEISREILGVAGSSGEGSAVIRVKVELQPQP